MDYHLRHVAVVPYQTSVVYGLRRRLVLADDDGSCARHVASLPWHPYEKREIYTYIDAYDVDSGLLLHHFVFKQFTFDKLLYMLRISKSNTNLVRLVAFYCIIYSSFYAAYWHNKNGDIR